MEERSKTPTTAAHLAGATGLVRPVQRRGIWALDGKGKTRSDEGEGAEE
jgi:hypothetical protein